MKNIMYISGLDLNKDTGVNKKILAQIKALENVGNEVSYVAVKDNKIYYYNKEKCVYIKKSSKNKIIKQIKLINTNIKMIKKLDNIDLLYIRYLFSTPQVIKMLKIAKKKNIRVIEEIPTYPYDEEIKNSKRLILKLALMVDKYFRRKLKKYLCNILTFSEDKEIFGIKTIKIDNGVDLDNISPINIKYNDNTINMIAVSSMEYWQGYDRAIKSLKKYYENKKSNDPYIFLHFVGDGRELNNLKKLVNILDLEKYVTFYGFLSGKELENIYDKCQCAIAGLGIFRKNISKASTLKIREYIAKSIPFIYSTIDESINEFKYAYKVSDDEEIFDMHSIIKFLENLNNDTIQRDMRSFAEQNYRWETQMKKVIEKVFLVGENNGDKC